MQKWRAVSIRGIGPTLIEGPANAERHHNDLEEQFLSFLGDIGLSLRKNFLTDRAWQHTTNAALDATNEHFQDRVLSN
jgi:hypothetical protein